MSDFLAVISKNALEDVRVALTEFKGYKLLDVRVWTERNDSTERVPTKKGISIKLAQLDELIGALEQAKVEASARGWIDE